MYVCVYEIQIAISKVCQFRASAKDIPNHLNHAPRISTRQTIKVIYGWVSFTGLLTGQEIDNNIKEPQKDPSQTVIHRQQKINIEEPQKMREHSRQTHRGRKERTEILGPKKAYTAKETPLSTMYGKRMETQRRREESVHIHGPVIEGSTVNATDKSEKQRPGNCQLWKDTKHISRHRSRPEPNWVQQRV